MTDERRRMTREERSDWYWRAGSLASVVAMGVVTYGMAYKLNAASDQKWCQVMQTYNSAMREQPPTSDPGRNMAARMAQLERDLGCPRRP